MTQTICWLVLFTALSPSFAQTLSITGNIMAANFMSGSMGVGTTTASPAATNRLTVAIIGFENKTGNPAEGYWRITASKLLENALWEVKTIRISPSVRYALKQLTKKDGDPIDEAEARKIGELIEARRVVWGGYQRQGTNWLVKARVLNVATGKVKELNATSADWFEIRDELSDQILKQLGIQPTPAEQQKMRLRWTSSPATLEWLSKSSISDMEGRPASETEACARRAVEADPKCAEAYTVLGAVLGTQGKMEEAEKAARESVNLRPDLAGAHATLGHLLGFQHRNGEGEDELSEAARLDPDDADVVDLLSTVYDQTDKDILAVTYMKKAVRLDPFSASSHAHLGYLYADQADREKAMPELRLAEQLVLKDDLNTEQFLCQAYKTLHEVPSAIEHYETFVRLGKKQGTNPEMVTSFEKTLDDLKSSLTPVYVTATMPREYTPADLAKTLHEKLTAEDLVVVTNPLASTPEMDRWARELTVGATNDLQKAQMLFNKLTRHVDRGPSNNARTAREMFATWNKPGQSFICQEYANFYVALARAAGLKTFFVAVHEEFDGEKALHACAGVCIADKFLLVDPSYCWFGVPHKQFTVLNDLQTVALHLSQHHPSPMAASIACKLAPDLAVAQINLFFSLVGAGQWKEASEALSTALKLEPDSSSANAARGVWALHEGKPEEAIGFLLKSVEVDPTQGDIYLRLAEAYAGQGKLREARNHFRNALHNGLVETDAEQARQAIAQINEKISSD
jgi:tetratricopeptide (TPR) repeat protein